MSNFLTNLFPQANEVPAAVALPPNLEQREYLLDGKLITWQGDMSPVLSPVCLKQPDLKVL